MSQRTVQEYAIIRSGIMVFGPQENPMWNETMTLQEAADLWYPGGKVAVRTRTIYEDDLTEFAFTPAPTPDDAEGKG